jgi:protein-S-isoprenylcysteine O-methyltransferase Ste14
MLKNPAAIMLCGTAAFMALCIAIDWVADPVQRHRRSVTTRSRAIPPNAVISAALIFGSPLVAFDLGSNARSSALTTLVGCLVAVALGVLVTAGHMWSVYIAYKRAFPEKMDTSS